MAVKEQGKNKMGTAPMMPLILGMGLPAMLSMMVQALYNIVDSYFVAQTGERALAAVSLAFPIQNLMIAFAVGTSVGVTSLISRRLGQGRRDAADAAAAHGIVLSLITALVFAVYGAFFTTPFFRLFTEDADLIAMGDTYISICCIFSFGNFLAKMLEKTLQATGNMIWPMILQLLGAVLNIILDPILIFGYLGFPAMGVAGAAIATVAAQIVTAIVCIVVVVKGDHEITITLRGFRWQAQTVKDIYAVGLPAIAMQGIGTVMNVAMNAILAGFSMAAYTVFGLYFRLQSFIFMPVFGLTQGLLPIMGYNYGAKNKKRLLAALRDGALVGLVLMTAGMILFMAIPQWLIGLFNPSEEMMTLGVAALRIISTCFPFAALGVISSTLFQAMGHGTYSLIISLLRQLVVLVPAAWILARVTGEVNAVWWSFPLAEVASLAVSVFFFIRIYRQEISRLEMIEGR